MKNEKKEISYDESYSGQKSLPASGEKEIIRSHPKTVKIEKEYKHK